MYGDQWIPVADFALAESAALAVAERKTGARTWDVLRFSPSKNFDLGEWQTDASDGVQADAGD
jgi:hypothetical protein